MLNDIIHKVQQTQMFEKLANTKIIDGFREDLEKEKAQSSQLKKDLEELILVILQS